MEAKDLGFELRHIGINSENAEEAARTVKTLCALFGFSAREMPGSYFVNEQFEVMKTPFYGRLGHIALAANDSSAAYEYLKGQGIEFEEESANYLPDGRLNVIYFKHDIAGFRFHLAQKQ